MEKFLPVSIIIDANGIGSVVPNPVLVVEANTLLQFSLLADGYIFPIDKPIDVTASQNFFAGPWSMSPTEVTLVDKVMQPGGIFDYQVNVTNVASGTTRSLQFWPGAQPRIKN